MPWKIVEDGPTETPYCIHKERADGTPGETVHCHASRENAAAQMRALYASEADMTTTLILDDFVTVKPGQPYRLFPFGVVVKNGRKHNITPEMAARFRLPHFKPPVKLGSHSDTTPAGGHIVGLEVRQDGLYALTELNDKGAAALEDGAYRYHSPEVIWEGGALEDPTTGEPINGPLIIGDALLHTPHLGEAAALYTIEPIKEGETMEDEIKMPASIWARFTAWLDKVAPGEPVQPDPDAAAEQMSAEAQALTEQMSAIQAERDEMAAKVARMEAEQAHRERVERFAADLRATKAEQNAELLASLSDDTAAWVLQQFRALSAQIAANDKLTSEIGTPVERPTDANAVVQQYATEHKMSYADALSAVVRLQPELFSK